MKRSLDRSGRTGCFQLILILLLSVLFAAAFTYLYEGGNFSGLAARAERLWRGVKNDLPRVSMPESISLPEAPAAMLASKLPGSAEIQVFFAPCSPANPLGVDDRLVALIEGAKTSVCCAFYELQIDSVANALIAQHKKGVKVGVVSDSDYKNRGAVRRCIEAGVPVVFDERDAFMHDKFCIVDGVRVWTGSTNVTESCMYLNNNNALLIESRELAEDFTAEFSEMFEKKEFGGRSPRATPYPGVTVGDVRISCYFSPEDKPQREIVREIGTAQTEIDFLAFSFTSKEIAEAMAKRIKQGVRVRGVFEARSLDPKYSRDKFLAERGAQVRSDGNQYTMHDKVIIVDTRTVITGSYNFTASAEEKNDENVLIVHSPNIAAQYAAEFEKLFAP